MLNFTETIENRQVNRSYTNRMFEIFLYFLTREVSNIQFCHGGIIKTGERASYQPNISDYTHAARLLSSHCYPFVSARDQPAKPHV